LSIVAAGPTPFWYLTRSAGVVAMLLLTASVVLGIVDFSRWRSDRWPRFVTDTLHRNVSMLALVMVVVHVITTVADGFAPIGFQDAIIPFLSPYRPFWLGLGALSFDALLAVAVTSLLRKQLGYRTWRAVHWAAYACWPLAMFHGLGTGTDASSTWMLALTAICLAAVIMAIGWRVSEATPRGIGRSLAATALGIGPIVLIVFSVAGPLSSNWAARAGTPSNLLPSGGATLAATSTAQSASLAAPFNARLNGSLKQRASAESGLASVELRMNMSRGASGTLDVTITGQPLEGGGVAMTQGSVALGPTGNPNLYTGHVVGLQGSRIVASAQSSDGSGMRLNIDVSPDQSTGSVSGTVQAERSSSA
jgi:hypothetical protein